MYVGCIKETVGYRFGLVYGNSGRGTPILQFYRFACIIGARFSRTATVSLSEAVGPGGRRHQPDQRCSKVEHLSAMQPRQRGMASIPDTPTPGRQFPGFRWLNTQYELSRKVNRMNGIGIAQLNDKLTWSLIGTAMIAILAWSGREPTTDNSLVRADPDQVTQNAGAVDDDQADLAAALPHTVDEARARARLLHEAFHGALQIMHRDFFREEQRLAIPSKSLTDVFREMKRTHRVELRWMAVNTNVMNIEHEPRDDFDRAAVKALSGDKDEFDQLVDGQFRYAGSVHLSASCVKCHVRSRTSNDSRKAALMITIPLETDSARGDDK